jgi:hypothetical protein
MEAAIPPTRHKSWAAAHIICKLGEYMKLRPSALRVFRLREAPNDPAKPEKESANSKYMHTGRTAPVLINVSTEIQKRPEQESTRAKVLHDLSYLGRKRWKVFAFHRSLQFRELG